MIKRMLLMLLAVGLLFGGIFGYKAYMAKMMMKYMGGGHRPPASVSAVKVKVEPWQPTIQAVGSLRAVRGVDVTSEVSGLVRKVCFQSGDEVKMGQLLVELNADNDIARLHSLQVSAALAQVDYERDKKQFAVQAVSQATLDKDKADFENWQAQVVEQEAIVDKKSIHAPFAGRLGISTINPGQYVNPGDKIVTLQALDKLYADFYLPQADISRLSVGQKVNVAVDAYPGRVFDGKIASINPKVDSTTRNIEIEAVISNPKHRLLPGMFASISVHAGETKHYLTVPQTAVSFNPYGETVYVLEKKQESDGKESTVAKQQFVTTGDTRGDQIAVLSGIKEGDTVVTAGQIKLRNGSPVVVDNSIQPSNNPAPKPVDQ